MCSVEPGCEIHFDRKPVCGSLKHIVLLLSITEFIRFIIYLCIFLFALFACLTNAK